MHANPVFRCFCLFAASWLLLLTVPAVRAQQASPAPGNNSAPPTTDPEFLATADEVMNEMAEITGWKVKAPLKKSIRTRADIHAYILSEMDDEKDAKERYASARSAEAFGLLPKNFDLDHFLVDLLTEQIAGLYDPKKHEFYIADWIQPDEQRMVMSHELTHALQDQYFHIDAWSRAAKPNDDAELARESVLEGSAMAGMLEYEMRDKGLKLTDVPDIDPSIFVGDLSDTPMLKKAPQFIKDSLMFPYFDGLRFSMSILRTGGWPGFAPVFDHPPSGTQQIMHPLLYHENKQPVAVKVDLPDGVPGDGWTKLEENIMGEFGWKEVLKQFLDEERAKKVMTGWDGDDYVTYEQNSNKQNLMLFTRLHFDSPELASGFFTAYRDALKRKYPERTIRVDAASDLEFKSSSAVNVFFRCEASDCITLEGAEPAVWQKWIKKLAWPATANPAPANTADSRPRGALPVLANAA